MRCVVESPEILAVLPLLPAINFGYLGYLAALVETPRETLQTLTGAISETVSAKAEAFANANWTAHADDVGTRAEKLIAAAHYG